jgi:hypothetical protein
MEDNDKNKGLINIKAYLTQATPPADEIEDTVETFSYDQVQLTEATQSTHIRLLTFCPLNPGKPSEIGCELKAVPMNDDIEPFLALSYTWGSQDFTYPISLNSRKHHVTSSLADALKAIRYQHSLPFWVDQICIDQSSIEERNAQVGLMQRIYSQAHQVLIWLGPEEDGSDELMDGLAIAGPKAEACHIGDLLSQENWPQFVKWIKGGKLDDGVPRPSFAQLCSEISPLMDPTLLLAWLRREWFHRVWIIQEYCLAKDPVFLCGAKSVHADHVRFAWLVWNNMPAELRGAGGQNPERLERLKLLMQLHELKAISPLTSARIKKQFFDSGKGAGSTLFQLLKQFAGGRRKCNNPSDWIYGLMALPSDVEDLGISPDYRVPYGVLYSKFARIVVRCGDLDILRYAQYPKSKDTTFPSWVPDWQEHPQTTFEYLDNKTEIRNPSSLFNASMDSQVHITDLGDENLLALQGFVVDDIEQLGPPWLGNITDHPAILGYLGSINLMCMLSAVRNRDIYRSQQRRAEAVWRIPIADVWNVTSPETATYNTRASSACEEGYRGVKEISEMFQERPLLPLEAQKEISRRVANLTPAESQYRNAMSRLQKKRPFMTTFGYVGLGPVFAKPGDRVVVLQGAVIPFVVRPAEQGRYQLLGEAYSDGIMDGEIVGRQQEEMVVLV